jgi:ABC-type phosphate/phosphonate transport system substrate-binding protein
MKRRTLCSLAGAALLALAGTLGAGSAAAQTKLKWAHVYETSESFHKQAVWAADEIKKKTNGRYVVEVFPASSLGKETEINQGLTLGTVDIIYTGAAFAGRAARARSARLACRACVGAAGAAGAVHVVVTTASDVAHAAHSEQDEYERPRASDERAAEILKVPHGEDDVTRT